MGNLTEDKRQTQLNVGFRKSGFRCTAWLDRSAISVPDSDLLLLIVPWRLATIKLTTLEVADIARLTVGSKKCQEISSTYLNIWGGFLMVVSVMNMVR